MMEKSVPVNSKSPSISILYNNIAPETLHFIGIFIPPTDVSSYTVRRGDVQNIISLNSIYYLV